MDDLLAPWKRKDGLTPEQIEGLEVDEPVHRWTVIDCQVMTVSTPPRPDPKDGLMTAWLKWRREDGTGESARLNARLAQFHLPENCPRKQGGEDAATDSRAG